MNKSRAVVAAEDVVLYVPLVQKVEGPGVRSLKNASPLPCRPVDGKYCLKCKGCIGEEDDALRLPIPHKGLCKLAPSTKSKFLIDWNSSTTTESVEYFHLSCFEAIYPDHADLRSAEKRLLLSVVDDMEKYQSSNSLQPVMAEISKLFRSTKHAVCFTGAGVSVSSGIPTYRGALGIDTIDESESSKKRKLEVDDDEDEMDYIKLKPTLAHLCLTELYNASMMHYCITQNCDNLHAKGGFPRIKLNELHGNVFIEYCETCSREYERDYCVDLFSTDCNKESWYVKCKLCGWNHFTGRVCTNADCKVLSEAGTGGKLRDTIVNFYDDLHDSVLGGLPQALEEASKADLCLCLGSSLTVTPANEIPFLAKTQVVVTPQATSCDDNATYKLYTTCDIFFTMLFNELEMILP